MKSKMVLKVGAVVSSLVLGAAFISYRAGAFDWPITSNEPVDHSLAEPEYTEIDVPSGELLVLPADAIPAAGEQIFYSSKSGAVFVEMEPTSTGKFQPSKETTQDSPTIMSGTKALLPTLPRTDKEIIMVGPKSPGGF